MGASNTSLMQSRYFSPAFNSAIFDGPFRIYFAQFQESLALKVYLLIQKKFANDLGHLKEQSKRYDSNILILLYPTNEIFNESFLEDDIDHCSNSGAVRENEKIEIFLTTESELGILAHRWQNDIVIGVDHAHSDKCEIQTENLLKVIENVTKVWRPMNLAETSLYQ